MADITKIVPFQQGLFTRVGITVHLLSHHIEDERQQMAFSYAWLTLYPSVTFRSDSTSLSVQTHKFPLTLHHYCWCWSISWSVPFLLFFLLVTGELTLRGYINTSCSGVHLTSPDSLRMRLDEDRIILKHRQSVQGFFFCCFLDLRSK